MTVYRNELEAQRNQNIRLSLGKCILETFYVVYSCKYKEEFRALNIHALYKN